MEAGPGEGPQGKMHAFGLGGGNGPIAKARARRGIEPPKKETDAEDDGKLGALPISRLVQRRILGAVICHDGGGWEELCLSASWRRPQSYDRWNLVFPCAVQTETISPTGKS